MYWLQCVINYNKFYKLYFIFSTTLLPLFKYRANFRWVFQGHTYSNSQTSSMCITNWDILEETCGYIRNILWTKQKFILVRHSYPRACFCAWLNYLPYSLITAFRISGKSFARFPIVFSVTLYFCIVNFYYFYPAHIQIWF